MVQIPQCSLVVSVFYIRLMPPWSSYLLGYVGSDFIHLAQHVSVSSFQAFVLCIFQLDNCDGAIMLFMQHLVLAEKF